MQRLSTGINESALREGKVVVVQVQVVALMPVRRSLSESYRTLGLANHIAATQLSSTLHKYTLHPRSSRT